MRVKAELMSDKDKALIEAIAEFMGVKLKKPHYADTKIYLEGFMFIEYNPLSNGTQREEFYEKVGMSIRPVYGLDQKIDRWQAWAGFSGVIEDKSRTKAALLCAANFLNVEWIG